MQTESLTVQTPSVHSTLSHRYLHTDVDGQSLAGGRKSGSLALYPAIPPSLHPSSPHSSLINPLYRFLIFIYLPEGAFPPLSQVLQQIPLDNSSLLLPNPPHPRPLKQNTPASLAINFCDETLLGCG